MSTFFISGAHDSELRIKSFSSTTKGEKATIRIELETDDLYWLGHTLRELAATQKSQRQKPKPEPKPLKPLKPLKPKHLAPPAPEEQG